VPPETSDNPDSGPLPKLKICGLRRPEQAAAVAALGVDAIGVIAVAGSPRFVPAEERHQLFAAVTDSRADCLTVLVTADPGEADLPELGPGCGHRVVQLHGSESAERCRELRSRLGLPLWKALRIRSPQDLMAAACYTGVVDALLLDAWVPDQLGGTGHRIPIDWLLEFAPALPWWLAGGITTERIADLLTQLRPDGLDVSSGVEDAPGEKNLSRVVELMAAVNRTVGHPPSDSVLSCPGPTPVA
jgi:phosphoribosylanthranilate isomerase